MPNKKDFSVDTQDFFAIGNEPEQQKTEPKEEKQAITKQKKEVKPVVKNTGEEKLKQRSYYTTDRLHKALKLRTIKPRNNKEKDISAIVRLALEQYLKDELREID